MVNTMSIYPEGIDPLIFFQDNDLEKLEVINTYNELISQDKYSEANQLLAQQDKLYGYFAEFFNLIENRIYALQEHLLTKSETKKTPFVFVEGEQEPSSVTLDTIWI